MSTILCKPLVAAPFYEFIQMAGGVSKKDRRLTVKKVYENLFGYFGSIISRLGMPFDS